MNNYPSCSKILMVLLQILIYLVGTELMLKNEELSVLTLTETNLEECNKNIFKIQGFESIYQSKIIGKHKGSGLAIYVK